MKFHFAPLNILAALACGISSSGAALIASESFWTTAVEADPQYVSGPPDTTARFNTLGNGDVVVGNLGFAATPAWTSATGTIFPTIGGPNSGGLTHSLVAGSVSPGATEFRVSHPRSVSRDLSATVPVSASYFLSGIVRAKESFADNSSYFAMGFGSGIGSGTHIGIYKNGSGEMRLGAFGGGSTFDLGAASLDTNYMIVVELTANSGGSDSLDAWVATDGGSLSQVLTGQSLETFSGVSSLNRLLMTQVGPNTTQITRAWGDEIRFGTTLADVVTVPEPSTGVLLSIVAGLVLVRRRRK